jgi:hypothetical protein
MKKEEKEFTLPLWVLDGVVGLLALMIYNFLLYLLDVAGTGGIIKNLHETMGYFGINSFMDLGFEAGTMSIGILIMFGFSFVLGMIIGSIVRKRRG